MTNEDQLRDVVRQEIREALETGTPYKDGKKMRVFKSLITPLSIALVGGLISWIIATADQKTNLTISQIQRDIEEQQHLEQLSNEKTIADAQEEVERIHQIDRAFQLILKEEEPSEKRKANIRSLAIHRDVALPFLARIRDYYKKNSESPSSPNYDLEARSLYKTALKTIENVLAGSQLDFSDMKFNSDQNKERRNLRFANLVNLNLSSTDFSNTNLFKADFHKSTMKKAKFNNADLQGANFQEANLSGASFGPGTNLRHADFEHTKLDGVIFHQAVENLGDAKFALGRLLNVKYPPFSDMNKDTYISLLVRHREVLDEDDWRVPDILEKLEMNFQELSLALDEKLHHKSKGKKKAGLLVYDLQQYFK